MCWRAQNINPTFLEIREKVLSENFSEDINRREIGDQMKKDCLFPAVNPRFEKKKKNTLLRMYFSVQNSFAKHSQLIQIFL